MERLGLVSVLKVDRLGLVSVLLLNVLWTSLRFRTVSCVDALSQNTCEADHCGHWIRTCSLTTFSYRRQTAMSFIAAISY